MTSFATRAASSLDSPRAKRMLRPLLGGYALLVAVVTLWPALKVPIPVHRSDLIAHMTSFGLLGLLTTAAGLFGPAFSRRNMLLSGLIAGVFAAGDEALQAIPLLNRTCAWDDMAANVMGILAAMLVMGWWGRMAGR